MAFEPGSQIAQYRLERRLGGGGMGDVYLAHDTRLDRLVAIKFLTKPQDPQARRRLLREARAVAALDHHGICGVYEVGADPVDGDFIAMQYVEGETLAARLRRGRMRPDEALNFGAQLAEALMAAHRRGIIHRDLKPQNIIVTPSGAPKILDFGLATFAPNTSGAANAVTTSQVTDPNTVVGTPAYMAPEQIRNEPADFRWDVFSLGAVIYECLTGRRAFQGATTAETLGLILHVDPAAVSSSVPELGPAYDVLCARLLHKIPEERFQSAEEVLGAIRSLTPSTRFAVSGPAVAPPRPSQVMSRVAAAVAAIAVAVVTWQLWPPPAPRIAPPDAARWYDLGVDGIRDGTYAAARSAFSEAIRLFPDYPQAYSRQAEAHIALDDERSAREALLKVAKLVPDRSRLTPEDQLRFDAASAAALRQHDAAIAAYQQLANQQPQDAGRWLDVGRANEAAQRLPAAREAYGKAVALDGQSAAGHLRLGVLQARNGQTAEGLASIDEAIRLYRAAAKSEGEAEALLRKGNALGTLGRTDAARDVLHQVVQLATDSRFPAQRIGAQLVLARLSYADGQFTDAEDLAKRAVTDATSANLPTLAAAGLIDLATFLIGRNLLKQADAQLVESIRLAHDRDATRVEMRAMLQRAALEVQGDHPQHALDLAEQPARYFKDSGEARISADANLILSRANEGLERYDEANRLAADALAFAENAKDDVRLARAVENMAGQLTKLGKLPEALAQRERIDDMHRRLKDQSALPKDLTNHAELAIVLGRGRDAEKLLREVTDGMTAGLQPYVDRRARVALLRALLASTECRWADAVRAVADVEAASPPPPSGTTAAPTSSQLFARVLGEHALAQLGRSRQAPAVVAKWPLDASTPSDRRDWSYWVARTLLARGEAALAHQVSTAALAEAGAQSNQELVWRLAAVAAQAARLGAVPQAGDSIAAQARTNLAQLRAAWTGAAVAYFARPDLAALVKSVQ